MRIRWTSDAANDLESIVIYILRENPAAARSVAQTILEAVAALKNFPRMGRPGHVEGTRELLFASLPYIAIYSVKNDVVEVLHIFHAAQDWH